MSIPVSARKTPEKTYYLFFALKGKYSGCYTTIKARNFEAAKIAALKQYGLPDIGSISNNKEESEGKIKAYRLTKI